MTTKELISLLGKTSVDPSVTAFLAANGITKTPKLKSDDDTAIVKNPKRGLEITFDDERFLDVPSNEYDEGALVLSNVRMYGDEIEGFKRFPGELPYGL